MGGGGGEGGGGLAPPNPQTPTRGGLRLLLTTAHPPVFLPLRPRAQRQWHAPPQAACRGEGSRLHVCVKVRVGGGPRLSSAHRSHAGELPVCPSPARWVRRQRAKTAAATAAVHPHRPHPPPPTPPTHPPRRAPGPEQSVAAGGAAPPGWWLPRRSRPPAQEHAGRRGMGEGGRGWWPARLTLVACGRPHARPPVASTRCPPAALPPPQPPPRTSPLFSPSSSEGVAAPASARSAIAPAPRAMRAPGPWSCSCAHCVSKLTAERQVGGPARHLPSDRAGCGQPRARPGPPHKQLHTTMVCGSARPGVRHSPAGGASQQHARRRFVQLHRTWRCPRCPCCTARALCRCWCGRGLGWAPPSHADSVGLAALPAALLAARAQHHPTPKASAGLHDRDAAGARAGVGGTARRAGVGVAPPQRTSCPAGAPV